MAHDQHPSPGERPEWFNADPNRERDDVSGAAITVCLHLDGEGALRVLLGKDLREGKGTTKNSTGMRKRGEEFYATALRELEAETGLKRSAADLHHCGTFENELWKRDPDTNEVVRSAGRPVVIGTYPLAVYRTVCTELYEPPPVSGDREMGDWVWLRVEQFDVWANRAIPYTQKKAIVWAVYSLWADLTV